MKPTRSIRLSGPQIGVLEILIKPGAYTSRGTIFNGKKYYPMHYKTFESLKKWKLIVPLKTNRELYIINHKHGSM